MDTPFRYAVLGSGAVGGLYGGMLAHAGADVHFLLHSDIDHVRKHGLRVESVLGDFHLADPNVYDSVDQMPRCDVVLVALKTTLNDQLDRLLPPLVDSSTVVLTLQNGLDVEADAERSVGKGRVLGGCCFLCSNKVGAGHIRHLDYGRIAFGVYRSAETDRETRDVEQRGRQILADLQAAGVDANWSDDLAATRWRKLMWNIPFNGLSVTLDASTDKLIGCPVSRRLAEQLIEEVHRGAATCGVSVPDEARAQTIRNTEKMVPYDSSMRLDDKHGRPMEVEAIFGAPLRAVGRALGQPPDTQIEAVESVMPRVSMLYHELSYRNQNRSSTPTNNP